MNFSVRELEMIHVFATSYARGKRKKLGNLLRKAQMHHTDMISEFNAEAQFADQIAEKVNSMIRSAQDDAG